MASEACAALTLMVAIARFGIVAVTLLAGCGSAEQLQNVTQIAVMLGGFVVIGGTWAGYKFGKDVEKEKDAASAVREKAADERAIASEKREKQLIESSAEQKAAYERLEEKQALTLKKLEPFEELAKKLHPTLDTEKALQLLREDLEKQKARSDALEAKSKVIEEAIADREVKPDQHAAIVKAANDLGGLPAFTVHASSANAEAGRYARALQAAFGNAGSKKTGVNFEMGGPLVTAKGLIIAVPPQAPGPVPPGARKLGEILQRAGIKFTIEPRPGLSGDDLQLVVGAKS